MSVAQTKDYETPESKGNGAILHTSAPTERMYPLPMNGDQWQKWSNRPRPNDQQVRGAQWRQLVAHEVLRLHKAGERFSDPLVEWAKAALPATAGERDRPGRAAAPDRDNGRH